MICDNVSINDKGHLTFAGYDTVDLANKYSTPLYLFDENKIREHVRDYRDAMKEYFPSGSVPEYASKAFSCKRIYEIMNEENIDIDVVSGGELYTAYKAGFPMERVFFHGNNKTDFEISYALDLKIGYFIVDNFFELETINSLAKEKNMKQKILLRVSPGIDPHTHAKISTGSTESKFGVPIETGDAYLFTKEALELENVELCGFHCHIGSQIFESDPFATAAEVMLSFIMDIKEKYDYYPEYLNLGGGFGVRYVESDPEISYREKIKETANNVNALFGKYNLETPKILMEPGRSLVADAGMTLYTVGSVKEIKDYKNYISIDGGMTDNPRYTLYESQYTIYLASRANDEKDFVATIAGKCCESGDLIQEDVKITKPEKGEILAVLTTGAYNYSMASNYNRIPRPAAVMLNNEKDYVIIKRESFEDITRLDV